MDIDLRAVDVELLQTLVVLYEIMYSSFNLAFHFLLSLLSLCFLSFLLLFAFLPYFLSDTISDSWNLVTSLTALNHAK